MCTCSIFFISLFYCLLNFIGNNVKVVFFVYYMFFPVVIIPIILIHAGYYTLSYSYCRRSRKRKPKPARPIRSVNHLATYYIQRCRHRKRQIINFTGSIINFTGSVYTTYTMKHSLLRKLPGLRTWKSTLRNDSSFTNSNKITTALSFKQQYNLWKSSFPSSEDYNLWKSSFPSSEEISRFLSTFNVLDNYH